MNRFKLKVLVVSTIFALILINVKIQLHSSSIKPDNIIHQSVLLKFKPNQLLQDEVSFEAEKQTEWKKTNWTVFHPQNWILKAENKKPASLETPSAQNIIKILVYDSFEWWGLPENTDKLKHCPLTAELQDCVLTEDKNSMDEVDAVVLVRDIFHIDEMEINEHSSLKVIYYTLESPYISTMRIDNENIMLASYWRGSDIWTPYHKWVYYDNNTRQKQQMLEKDYQLRIFNLEKGFFMRAKNFAHGKTKLAAIIVSNCNAMNGRLEYVRKLQSFMQVDVYGACAALSCLNDETSEDTCFEDIKSNYKFYLSFENANCRDYITEKFFRNALMNDAVPIVLGAHRLDYKALAPENSYIHVEDFETPEELAKYVKLLDKNDSLYNSYFKWRDTGKFVPSHFFCEICAMLKYSKYSPIVGRLGNQFVWDGTNEELCLRFDKWYWDRPG